MIKLVFFLFILPIYFFYYPEKKEQLLLYCKTIIKQLSAVEEWLLPIHWLLFIFKNKWNVRNNANSNGFNGFHNDWDFDPMLWKPVGSFINKININTVKLSSVCSLLSAMCLE